MSRRYSAQHIADITQQLDVLRPGGLYAWKTKYEAAESALTACQQARDEALKEVASTKRCRVCGIRLNWEHDEEWCDIVADKSADLRLRAAFEAGFTAGMEFIGEDKSSRFEAWDSYRRTLTAPPHEQTREEEVPPT